MEQMLVNKGECGAVLLPRLVALGEADDDASDDEIKSETSVSNTERVIVLAKLLTAQMHGGIGGALPVARDLVRMMDYLENERDHDAPMDFDINWTSLVGDRYAHHFVDKAKFLDLAMQALPAIFPGKFTSSQKRNNDLRAWIKTLDMGKYARVFVCGSTASVPATSDLMAHIAGMDNGYILLPGKIKECGVLGAECEITNPYNSINKFLNRIGVAADDVNVINTGASAIEFFNYAFSNETKNNAAAHIPHSIPVRIDCAREAEEAEVVAEIASDAVRNNKTVLIVTPDIAGNTRTCESLKRRGIDYDTSGGISGSMTPLGRYILGAINKQIELKKTDFLTEYKNCNDLFKTLKSMVQSAYNKSELYFDITDDAAAAVWDAIIDVSEIIGRNGLDLSLTDIFAILSDTLSGVSIRSPIKEDIKISILGTIEARMQSADVVILTGLNEGMFPALGYENPWLPRRVSDAIGLPDSSRKVSLMALDFMVLSCGKTVFWTRSKMSGSGETTESRFLSRVSVCLAKSGLQIANGDLWLNRARAHDDIPLNPIDTSAPRPPAIYDTVYVTELELLIHNPYAFYCRHILRLYPENDPWEPIGPKEFGTMVHSVIEDLDGRDISEPAIVAMLDARAKTVLEQGSILFHFWHKRFVDMAPHIKNMIDVSGGPDVLWSGVETNGACEIAGRDVRAKADKVWVRGTTGVVLDVKTGGAPNKKQLMTGMMPQLPLEAYMLQSNGFGYSGAVSNLTIQFLQLKNRDARIIEYTDVDVRQMIAASIDKVSQLFGRYSHDFEPYEYYETSDMKYKAYDDLARKES